MNRYIIRLCFWLFRFYPFHYAPYVSELKNFGSLSIEFELGSPFLPFEQLLAVLPANSRFLLPEAYRVSATPIH